MSAEKDNKGAEGKGAEAPRAFLPRPRRTSSSWEPFFDPAEADPFPEHDWNFQHNRAPAHVTLTAEGLNRLAAQGKALKFVKIRFIKCDFLGIFDFSPREIIFNDCHFEMCDFGQSTWIKVKFSRCNFVRVSFTQSIWSRSEFRDSVWKNIGISGNTTEISETIITNPSKFIDAAHVSYKLGGDRGPFVWRVEQWMRLQKTKSEVSRVVAQMLAKIGDEFGYYDAVKSEANCSVKWRLSRRIFEILKPKDSSRPVALLWLVANILEYCLLNVAGFLNSWGRSVARPAVWGAIIIATFSIIYKVTEVDSTWLASAIKSTEITLLVGYTNFTASAGFGLSRLAMVANLLIGLFWYIVFVPTLVNRVSRVR